MVEKRFNCEEFKLTPNDLVDFKMILNDDIVIEKDCFTNDLMYFIYNKILSFKIKAKIKTLEIFFSNYKNEAVVQIWYE